MNARMFKRAALGFSSNVSLLQRAKYHSTATRPPVLLLGEVHSRPAAKDAIYHNLRDLKQRGYNVLMAEGIKGGNTLEEELSKEHQRKKIIETLYERTPALIELMNRRYQLTHKDFVIACKKLLEKASPPFNHSANDANTLIGYISRYFESDISFFNRLINMGFSYENLDKNTSDSVLRPWGSRRDLNFRDAQYATIISQAYEQGKNVISILGAFHVLPDPDPILSITDKFFGPRQLMGDRLRERGIPSITLFPFNSSHIPAADACKAWEKQNCNSSISFNSSNAYSIDIEGSNSKTRFLNLIDALSSSINTQAVDNTEKLNLVIARKK